MNVFSACADRLWAAAILLMLPAWSMAAEMAEEKTLPPAPDPMASAGKVLIFLILIIALIFVLAWLASRLRGQGFVQSSGNLKIVESQSIGVKEKIAVVQVGNKQILVGITSQQITHLTDLEEPLAVQVPQGNVNFSDLLKKAIRQ